MNEMKANTLITESILREWSACKSGLHRFCELFPDGADLKTAADRLAKDGHSDWSIWLFEKCRGDERFKEQTKDGFSNTGDSNTGYRNTGDSNTGHWNTGHWNTGHWNTGHWNTGHWNTGDRNTGDRNTGDSNTGDRNTGDRNTGDRNTGDRNTGHWNTGYRNTGDSNTGDSNTGDSNTGDSNTGDSNTGHWNTGHRNTGYRNTGYRNTGDSNTGHWNTGHWNTGHFNTITPDDILAFNKPCKRSAWDECKKPNLIYNLVLTWWVSENEMTDAEKAADPNFYMRGGQLRCRTYKEAWRKAWDEASVADRELVRKLPNFDATVFKEISGIDVDTELQQTGGKS